MAIPPRISRVLPALVVAIAAIPAAGREFTLRPRWIAGGTGSSIGRFGTPESVALDSLGHVVVTDKGRMLLHVYAADDGAPLLDVGGLGSRLGTFDRPNGVAVDAAGRILVVEQRNQRVQMLDRDYRALGAFGRPGSGPGGFQKPMGIALDAAGRIYVTDEARADVQVFDAQGAFLWRFPLDGPRLSRVESIEVHASSGRIFVCDEGRSLVNIYDLAGRYQSSFGGEGSALGRFGDDPNAVRLDGQGRIYVNDQGNRRINVYAADTRPLAAFRSAAGDMESADGVALSEAHDLLLVADQGNDRVLAFTLSEMQCRLALVELQSPAESLGALRWVPESPDDGGLPWADGTLVLEADGPAGDPARAEQGLVHLRSRRDRRGVCVPLVETGIASRLYRARVHLGEATGTGTLAVFADDTLRAHVPGRDDEVVVGLAVLPPPEIEDLNVPAGAVPGAGSALRLAIDAPTIVWRTVDPAGRRRQSGFEARLRSADGRLLWQSGVLAGAGSVWQWQGPPLAPGITTRLEMRVRAGRAWSTWAGLELRRNRAPLAACSPSPPSGTRVARWPVQLASAYPRDADQDPLRVWVEIVRGSRLVARMPIADTVLVVPRAEARENDRMRWRVVASDGCETTAGRWWQVDHDALVEPPSPPRPLAPAQGAVHTDTAIRFAWQPSTDPDPGDVPSYLVEWSSDASFAAPVHARAVTGTEIDWNEPVADGPLYWRVRALDGRGASTCSEVRQLELVRAQAVVIEARAGALAPAMVSLGTRAGAHDAFVPGEDSLASPTLAGLGLASLVEHPPGTTLSTDWRALPVGAARACRWTLGVQGPPGKVARLRVESIAIGTARHLLLLDDQGRKLAGLHRAGDGAAVVLDGLGVARVLVELAAPRDRPGAPDAALLAARGAEPPAPIEASPVIVRRGQVLAIARSGAAPLALYDVRGRMLRRARSAPDGTWAWDGIDGRGARLAPGVYFLAVESAPARRKLVWSGR